MKKVTFDMPAKTLFPNRLSKNERKFLWWQSKDIASFRNGVKETIQQLRRCNGHIEALNEDEYCLRGLEQYVYQCRRKKQYTRKKLVNIILDLQSQNRKQGLNDPESLRLSSAAYSKNSRFRARVLGAQDEEDSFILFSSDIRNGKFSLKNMRAAAQRVEISLSGENEACHSVKRNEMVAKCA